MESIKLFGISDCKNTLGLIDYFKGISIEYTFYDIGESDENQWLLSRYYRSNRLHFPTVVLNEQKLKKPSAEEITNTIITQKINHLEFGDHTFYFKNSKYLVSKNFIPKTNKIEFSAQCYTNFNSINISLDKESKKTKIQILQNKKTEVLQFLVYSHVVANNTTKHDWAS